MHAPAADASPGRIRRVVGWAALVSIGVGTGLALSGLEPELLFTVLGYVAYLSAGYAVAQEARRVGSPLPPIGDLRLTRRNSGALLAVTVSTFIVSVAGLYLSLIALSWPFADWVSTTFLQPDDDRIIPTGVIHRAFFAIEAIALAPMVEELVFRGVMLHWWSQVMGLRRAVITSALIFGAMHFDPLGSTLFALVASALYMSTGTMLAPIVFHALWNCSVTIIGVASSDVSSEGDSIASLRESWWWAIIALVAAGVVLWRTLRALRPADGWRLPDLGGAPPPPLGAAQPPP